MTDILITTTPVLKNIEIHRYMGPLTANIVLGVNFFSDFAASLTDVFGGNSETYQSKLDILTDDVNKLMKAKAMRMGANAIIDYKLQFNEISGKGKQMFMVTATGTACLITMPQLENEEVIGQVSYSQIQREYLMTFYRQRLSNSMKLTSSDWDNIISFNMFEISSELIGEYFRIKLVRTDSFDYIQYRDTFIPKFEEYFSRLNKSDASENIYQYIDSNPEFVVELAIKYNLFDPKVVIDLISSNKVSLGISLLRSNKDYYTKEDLRDMLQIVNLLNNLEDKGSFQMSKSGIFSKKEEEIYICPNGHKNSKDSTYCISCDQNIKGLTSDQDKIIDKFKMFTTALETLIK